MKFQNTSEPTVYLLDLQFISLPTSVCSILYHRKVICPGCIFLSAYFWFIQPTSSVQFSCSVVSDSLQPHELQHAKPPCPSPTPRVHPNSCASPTPGVHSNSRPLESVMPSNHLILCRPLLLLPWISPSNQGLFQWVDSSHEVVKVLEFQLQHQSFQWRSGLL